jgi:hypothetical protein
VFLSLFHSKPIASSFAMPGIGHDARLPTATRLGKILSPFPGLKSFERFTQGVALGYYLSGFQPF